MPIVLQLAHRARVGSLCSFCVATQLHVLYHLLLKFGLHVILLSFCCGDAECVLLQNGRYMKMRTIELPRSGLLEPGIGAYGKNAG